MHDALGNKTGEPASIPAVGRALDLSHMLSYGYDTRDEMTAEQSAQAGNGSGGASVYGDTFGYDLSFNPTTFKGSSVTENIDNQFSLPGFSFDGNGSPTTYKGSNLTFDIENRLVSITSPAFAAAYAPDDRRASKTVSGTTTYYLYDEDGGAAPLLEEQGTGTVSMGYGQAADGLRARYAPQSGGLYYLFQWDPQGSLVQRQTGGPGGNTTSYALDTAMFDGYGVKLSDTDTYTGGVEQPNRDAMGFQGQFGAYQDNETGLVLMGHRYYDAGTGRFLTRDPLGYGGGINLYGFTGNNPVNEVDPDGTFGEGQSTADPLDASIERTLVKVGRESRIVIRPVGLGALRIAGGTVGLFFASTKTLGDDSTGPGSPYATRMSSQRRAALRRDVESILAGRDVEVSSIREADTLLINALPSAIKYPGTSNKKPNFDLFTGKDPRGMYHKDYNFDPATDRIYGHDENNRHGSYKHINIKLPSGRKVNIIITPTVVGRF